MWVVHCETAFKETWKSLRKGCTRHRVCLSWLLFLSVPRTFIFHIKVCYTKTHFCCFHLFLTFSLIEINEKVWVLSLFLQREKRSLSNFSIVSGKILQILMEKTTEINKIIPHRNFLHREFLYEGDVSRKRGSMIFFATHFTVSKLKNYYRFKF